MVILTPQKQLGSWAEDCAKYHAQQQGFICIQQNYHCRGGELDLILEKERLLIFMEVKARFGNQYGTAIEMLTPRKQQRMQIAISHFLEHHLQYAQHDYRFDLFAIQFQYPAKQNIERIKKNLPIPYQYEWVDNAFLWI